MSLLRTTDKTSEVSSVLLGCIRLKFTFSHGKLHTKFGKLNCFFSEDGREI